MAHDVGVIDPGVIGETNSRRMLPASRRLAVHDVRTGPAGAKLAHRHVPLRADASLATGHDHPGR